MDQTKECRLCHRIGTRDFLVAGAEQWECGNDRACKRRAERRERAEGEPAESHPVTDDFHDAPDGAVIEWPDFGPGLWRRCGDRWHPATADIR